MKRIMILTGARSEFGILEPVYRAIEQHPDLEPQLLVTGVHLLSRYGGTASEVARAGIEPAATVPFYEHESIEDHSLPGAIGRGVAGIGESIKELESDLVVVLGDRAEAMAGALAAYSMGIGLAHLHGGEKTDSGHRDEGFRHAITRLAHLHFAATEVSARRLLSSGEEPWRVHRVGAPGLDNVHRFVEGWNQDPLRRAQEFRERYALPGENPFVVFLFHPDRLTQGDAGALASRLLDECLQRGLAVLAIHPNSDPGSGDVIAAIEAVATRAPERVRSHASLSRDDFHAALATGACLVGNSSAGIIEAPAFGIPVLNVGERNRDREHDTGVHFIAGDTAEDVACGLRETLPGDSRSGLSPRPKRPSPYGDGTASQAIAETLARVEVGPALLRKLLLV